MMTPQTIDGNSIPHAYLRRVSLNPQDSGFAKKVDGHFAKITWNSYHRTILSLFHHLRGTGFQSGDRGAILADTRLEWSQADLAIQCSGGVSVPIYPSLSTEETAAILEDCGATYLFVENPSQLKKAREALKLIEKTIPIIQFQGVLKEDESHDLFHWEDIVASEAPESTQTELEESVAAIEPTDLASIVYTSGTTGKSKGAKLTHENFLSELRGVISEVDINGSDSTLSFLPFPPLSGVQNPAECPLPQSERMTT